MDIDAVKVFVKVIETGSFSGAARVLKMPKTTVSAKVAALEKRLGVTLIQRTTRRLHVTDAGQTYFRHCALAIKEIEIGEASLFASQDHPSGLLRLTAPIDIGHSILPSIVCGYLKKYPDTEVELILTNRMIDLVGEGVDLAIRVGQLKDSTLVARKFFDVNGGFWASPAYIEKYGSPASPRDFVKHQVIVHPAMKAKGFQVSDGKTTHTLEIKSRVTADDIETIKVMTILGSGIGWLPDFLATPEYKKKALVQVLPKWRILSSGHYAFVYPGQKYMPPKVRAFIDLATSLMAEQKKPKG